jgi:hypothetical protein
LDLSGAAGDFNVQWFNPRTGGALVAGEVTRISGGAKTWLGEPPADPQRDWAVLIRKR